MKTNEALKRAARWLLGREDRKTGCCVDGCSDKPTIVVAGDSRGTTLMCRRHGIAWSESNLCRDYAQHNSSAGPTALGTWIEVSRATAQDGISAPRRSGSLDHVGLVSHPLV